MGQVPLKLSLACRCYLAREDAVVGTRVESRTVGGSCEGTGLCRILSSEKNFCDIVSSLESAYQTHRGEKTAFF